MSESRGAAEPAAVERELDPIADELYALRPDEFAGARDAHVREARSAGKQPLARELAKLRRPTQSAWLVNLLWRDQREVIEQLLELATEMSRAQAQVSGAELRQLTGQRREIESALLRRAEELARERGVDVSASMAREAQETLAAALAQPEVADEVRSGRLVKPAAYAGFGPSLSGAPPDIRESNLTEKKPRVEPKSPKENVVELRAAQRARERREQAESQRAQAQVDVKAAAGSLAELTRAADDAQEQHQQLRQRIDEVQAQLRELQAEAIAADRTARTAAQRRDQADKEHTAAQRMLERAEQHLNELPT